MPEDQLLKTIRANEKAGRENRNYLTWLARNTSYGREQLKAKLNKMEEKGWIEREKHKRKKLIKSKVELDV